MFGCDGSMPPNNTIYTMHAQDHSSIFTLCVILVQCSAFLASGSDPTDDSRKKRID